MDINSITYPHCCVCSGVCGHTGPATYCKAHSPFPTVAVGRPITYGWVCPHCNTTYSPNIYACSCAVKAK